MASIMALGDTEVGVERSEENENEESKSLLDNIRGGEEKNNTDRPLLQTLLGLGASFIWLLLIASAAVSVALLEKRIPDFELNTFRCTGPFIIQLVVILFMRKIPVIPKEELIGASFYILSLLLGSLFYYISFTLLPPALIESFDTAANLTSGLILFYLLNGEKITVTNVLCSVLCMVGAVLVLQPEGIFKQYENVESSNITAMYFDNQSEPIMKNQEVSIKESSQLSRVAGTMVARSSSVRAVARSNLSQVPPLHMHVGK